MSIATNKMLPIYFKNVKKCCDNNCKVFSTESMIYSAPPVPRLKCPNFRGTPSKGLKFLYFLNHFEAIAGFGNFEEQMIMLNFIV